MWDFVLGFVLGYIICMFQIRSAIEKAVEEVLSEQDSDYKTKVKLDVVPARLESCDGQFLLYNHSTNEFIAQGSDYQELVAAIKLRWENFSIQIVDGDPDTIKTLKSQSPSGIEVTSK